MTYDRLVGITADRTSTSVLTMTGLLVHVKINHHSNKIVLRIITKNKFNVRL